MKKLNPLLIIVFCILFQQSMAQEPATSQKKPALQKKAVKHLRFKIGRLNPHPSDDDCVFTSRYSLEQRLKRYPFYKAKKIIAVSFLWIEPNPDFLINDTLNMPDTLNKKINNIILNKNLSDTLFKAGIHIKNGKLNYSSLIETKQLNTEQIGRLTNIIYNTKVKKPSNYAVPGYNCYMPRNALIFYDNDGKIFDYLEVCFECKRDESQSQKITTGNYCNQKYDLLKSFFVDAGIKYGTTTE